ncbi:MFS transporter [Veronia nyctiphanis]|uniref:MFS transporter n=2 Tax=Veronia nyctiphanis TaxID=1278244 RepID=A0A4Q0YLN0_9GAMM|nr:MFS transporter [Veronia nyctiphanis]
MVPLLSLYLSEALNAEPLMVSLFLGLSLTSGVLVSQHLAKLSDKGVSRKKLIATGLFCSMIASSVFAITREYYVAIAVSVLVLSFSAVTLPQVFALIREYADQQKDTDTTLMMTSTRACIALAWVCGPPLAFICHDAYGFNVTFFISAFISLMTIVLALTMLPDMRVKQDAAATTENSQTEVPLTPWYKIPAVLFFSVAVLLMFFANNLYLISMPLYMTQEMGESSSWVGKLFGLAAFMEIPIMIGGGYLVKYFGARRMVAFGVMSGMLFFLSMSQTTEIWQMLVLQVLNGIYIGTTATLGMVLLQDMMPKQRGVATTLFSNGIQLGNLTASLALGVIGEFVNYHFAFYLCAGAAMLSLAFIVIPTLLTKRKNLAPITQ